MYPARGEHAAYPYSDDIAATETENQQKRDQAARQLRPVLGGLFGAALLFGLGLLMTSQRTGAASPEGAAPGEAKPGEPAASLAEASRPAGDLPTPSRIARPTTGAPQSPGNGPAGDLPPAVTRPLTGSATSGQQRNTEPPAIPPDRRETAETHTARPDRRSNAAQTESSGDTGTSPAETSDDGSEPASRPVASRAVRPDSERQMVSRTDQRGRSAKSDDGQAGEPMSQASKAPHSEENPAPSPPSGGQATGPEPGSRPAKAVRTATPNPLAPSPETETTGETKARGTLTSDTKQAPPLPDDTAGSRAGRKTSDQPGEAGKASKAIKPETPLIQRPGKKAMAETNSYRPLGANTKQKSSLPEDARSSLDDRVSSDRAETIRQAAPDASDSGLPVVRTPMLETAGGIAQTGTATGQPEKTSISPSSEATADKTVASQTKPSGNTPAESAPSAAGLPLPPDPREPSSSAPLTLSNPARLQLASREPVQRASEDMPQPVARTEPDAPMPPPPPPPPPPIRFTPDGPFLVQVGAMANREMTCAVWEEMERRWPDLFLKAEKSALRTELPDGRIVYRMRAGAFASREEATRFCKRMTDTGGECFVTTR